MGMMKEFRFAEITGHPSFSATNEPARTGKIISATDQLQMNPLELCST